MPRRILLIIGGGIAAYKSLDLIRSLRKRGDEVDVILTKAGEEFVTKLSVAALAGTEVRADLFNAAQEQKMGHIELARAADLMIVAPATADLLAKLSCGLANDLASAALLATGTRVLLAPAMNVRMWEHPATQRNIAQLKKDSHVFIGPNEGEMACGEFGTGRMAETDEIITAIDAALAQNISLPLKGGGLGWGSIPAKSTNDPPPEQPPIRGEEKRCAPLTGKHIIVTSGPTYEPLDPVRYLANRSSGKQGHAIAQAAARAGARVTLISGPTHLHAPGGVRFIGTETALEMWDAVEAALPADVFIGCAAVSDWRAASMAGSKIKKIAGSRTIKLELVENPDILMNVAGHENRPRLVIGFAAETENLETEAKAKRLAKGCDWILANDVSKGQVFGADENEVNFITADGAENWPRADKAEIAERLIARVETVFK
jgi:phosphopantothenoylcysteine decarboxylase/phosphopantothenate--cysteine ligase